MNTAELKQKNRSIYLEKYLQRRCRMSNNFWEIRVSRRKDYTYSDANRNRMMDILNNPKNFSEEEKIDTLLSFHKDTCANVALNLYPSGGDDFLHAFQDLGILKRFEHVLVELELEFQRTNHIACYHSSRAKKRLLQMKISMSALLKSPEAAALSEDIKNWMSQKLGCDDDDDDYYYNDYYYNDEKRLQSLETSKSNALAYLQRQGVDMSKYQDNDDGDQYLNFQPTQAGIDDYMRLEEKATRMDDQVSHIWQDAHPIPEYLKYVKQHTKIMETNLTTGVIANLRRRIKLYRRNRRKMNRQKTLKKILRKATKFGRFRLKALQRHKDLHPICFSLPSPTPSDLVKLGSNIYT